MSLQRTIRQRPDLIEARGGLDEREVKLLGEFGLDLPGSQDSSRS